MDFNLPDAYNEKNLTEKWYLLGDRGNAQYSERKLF